MHDQSDILISVRSNFVDSMLNGTKRVELRRRAPRISSDSRIWIYSKAPVAAVTAMAHLSAVEILPPDKLWQKYQSVLDLSLSEFEAYVSGRDEVAALCIRSVHAMRPVTLKVMRHTDPKFHPPQFYLRLASKNMLLSIFEKNLVA